MRLAAPIASDPKAAATALASLRKALGPHTLLLLSGGAEDAVLTPEALAATLDVTLAPIGVVAETTPHLEDLLAPSSGDLEDPKAPIRANVKALFGGSLADLLRRLP